MNMWKSLYKIYIIPDQSLWDLW